MLRALTSAYKMHSRHGFADIMQNMNTGEKSLHANAFYDAGETITAFEAIKVFDKPKVITLQTSEAKHILLEPECLQYTNHSCDPNVFFDTTLMELIALKEIQPGDELMFFYPSTEWDMDQPFECFCGTHSCLHTIKGAAYLSAKHLARYKLTDYIIEKIQTPKKK